MYFIPFNVAANAQSSSFKVLLGIYTHVKKEEGIQPTFSSRNKGAPFEQRSERGSGFHRSGQKLSRARRGEQTNVWEIESKVQG